MVGCLGALLDSCGIAANIDTAETLTAVVGDGGAGSEWSDVTETFGKDPSVGLWRSLAPKVATARRFVAEQQFLVRVLRQTMIIAQVSTVSCTASCLMVCIGLSTSTLG
jgi:hypothetical protein